MTQQGSRNFRNLRLQPWSQLVEGGADGDNHGIDDYPLRNEVRHSFRFDVSCPRCEDQKRDPSQADRSDDREERRAE